MADAYLRFTINGKKHSSYGNGRRASRETFDSISKAIREYGKLTDYWKNELQRFAGLNNGDIVQVDLVYRCRRGRFRERGNVTKASLRFRTTRTVSEGLRTKIIYVTYNDHIDKIEFDRVYYIKPKNTLTYYMQEISDDLQMNITNRIEDAKTFDTVIDALNFFTRYNLSHDKFIIF